MLWDGKATHVLLEGVEADVDAQSGGLHPVDVPALPGGAPRADVGRARRVGRGRSRARRRARCALVRGARRRHRARRGRRRVGARGARAVAHEHGGWLLREAGGADLDGFGCELPNADLMRRVKSTLDPTGKLAPGRLPL